MGYLGFTDETRKWARTSTYVICAVLMTVLATIFLIAGSTQFLFLILITGSLAVVMAVCAALSHQRNSRPGQ